MLIKIKAHTGDEFINPEQITHVSMMRGYALIHFASTEMIPLDMAEWERIEPLFCQQPPNIAKLEEKIAELESELEQVGILIVSDEEFEELEERVFLRDIGFDPDNLPSSVGERADLRRALFRDL